MLNLESLTNSPYWITSPHDVHHVLKALWKKKEPIFIKLNENFSFLSLILSVNDNEIILDATQKESINHQASLLSSQIQAHGLLEKISIDFFLEQGKEIIFENNTAFSFPIPKKIHELQRRKFYRLPTPIVNPLVCSLTIQKTQQSSKIYESTVFDISLLGLCIEKIAGLNTQEGESYENCFIVFPNKKIIRFGLTVKRIFSLEIKKDILSERLGCSFNNLKPQDEQTIQSYMIQLEREKIFALRHL